MGVLFELGVADPVPPLDAPADSHQLQQCFWGGPDARKEEMAGIEWCSVALTRGDDQDDSARADPLLADVLWRLYCSQRLGDVSAMAELVIRFQKMDLACSLELPCDLAMQGPLVGFDR